MGLSVWASWLRVGTRRKLSWIALGTSSRVSHVSYASKTAHGQEIALQKSRLLDSPKGSGHTPAARDAADANQLLAAITTINNWCLGSQLAAVTLCVSCTSSASRTLSARNT